MYPIHNSYAGRSRVPAFGPLDGSLMFLVTFGSVTIRILGHALLSLLAGVHVYVHVSYSTYLVWSRLTN